METQPKPKPKPPYIYFYNNLFLLEYQPGMIKLAAKNVKNRGLEYFFNNNEFLEIQIRLGESEITDFLNKGNNFYKIYGNFTNLHKVNTQNLREDEKY